MAEKIRKNILIVDPERDTAELFSRALESHGDGYKCYWVKDPQHARVLLCDIEFSFLLADVSILQDDHFLLLSSVHEASCRTVVIANAYLGGRGGIRKAMEKGAAGYFMKPITVSSLRKIIDDLSAQ